MHINIEIKARCTDHAAIQKILATQQARYIGLDHQIDTYFQVPSGRLKLRQGNIENSLIFYQRTDQAGPKQSDVQLYQPAEIESLKMLLREALGIKIVVDKQRAIYFIENVKFHLDEVKGLGTFIEIEAIDKDGSIGIEKLQAQCKHYMQLFGIRSTDLVEGSYSDLLDKTK